jgi:hypothetical protein
MEGIAQVPAPWPPDAPGLVTARSSSSSIMESCRAESPEEQPQAVLPWSDAVKVVEEEEDDLEWTAISSTSRSASIALIVRPAPELTTGTGSVQPLIVSPSSSFPTVSSIGNNGGISCCSNTSSIPSSFLPEERGPPTEVITKHHPRTTAVTNYDGDNEDTTTTSSCSSSGHAAASGPWSTSSSPGGEEFVQFQSMFVTSHADNDDDDLEDCLQVFGFASTTDVDKATFALAPPASDTPRLGRTEQQQQPWFSVNKNKENAKGRAAQLCIPPPPASELSVPTATTQPLLSTKSALVTGSSTKGDGLLKERGTPVVAKPLANSSNKSPPPPAKSKDSTRPMSPTPRSSLLAAPRRLLAAASFKPPLNHAGTRKVCPNGILVLIADSFSLLAQLVWALTLFTEESNQGQIHTPVRLVCALGFGG